MASKYDGLAAYLRRQQGPTHTMTFPAVGRTLTPPPLPHSAHTTTSWWANDHSADATPQARNGWHAAGWDVDEVDMATGVVTFRKITTTPPSGRPSGGGGKATP